MSRIPDESVGGVLSVVAIAYSANPNLVAKQIDRILVPGGIAKIIFPVNRHVVELGAPVSGKKGAPKRS